MVNDRQQEPLEDWQRQAWLTEYQALQRDNSSSGSTYWTMAAIFIGISSAILGGLLYSVLSNSELLRALLNVSKYTNNAEVNTIKIVVTVISIFMFLVLVSLRFWLRRVSFLQQVNFERMREIECKLGMWKSWRVHGIDHWEGSHFDKAISSEDSERLLNYKEPKWWSYWKKRQRYARPSGSYGSYYDWLFTILLFVWLLPILLVFWPKGPIWVSIISFSTILIIWGFVVWYAIRSSRVRL
jgi:hypothetical protein